MFRGLMFDYEKFAKIHFRNKRNIVLLKGVVLFSIIYNIVLFTQRK